MTKKSIIWTSVAVLAVGATIGGVVWWQNRDKPSGGDDDILDDGFKITDVDLGSTSGGGASTGGSSATMSDKQNFTAVKNAFPTAKVYGNRISYAKTIDLGGGITSEVIVFFYDNGRFSFTVDGVNSVMKGSYYDGAKRMQVTDAKGNWSGMKGRIVSSSPANNVITLVKRG